MCVVLACFSRLMHDLLDLSNLNSQHLSKYKNVRAGNDKVALLIDDMESIKPWKPRGIRIYGTAEFIERTGQFGPGTYMRITPEVSWSSDLVGPALVDGKFQPNKINHSA